MTNDYFDIYIVLARRITESGRGNNAWNAYMVPKYMNTKILFFKE
jgi:hypothetical protein